jgi:PAS domain S-box-containing protein
MPYTNTPVELKKTIPWHLMVIFLIFSAGIVLTGIVYYKSQKTRIFKEEENNLSAIASLKIGQIKSWHKERLGDAAVISLDKPLIRTAEQFFYRNNNTVKTELSDWMKSVETEYDYNNVLLTDRSFKVRLSIIPSDTILGDSIKTEIRAAMTERRIIMTELHRSKEVPYIHIDILVPLFDSVDKIPLPVGTAILRIDPGKALFPLIQSWPTLSRSSETLIVRKEGDSVLYLNELRHVQNTALKLKVPFSDKNILSSKAVSGFEGVVEGVDYRKVPVVGYITKIDGLPWYMVAKVDKEEVLSPLHKYVLLIIIVVILLILINASIFGFWIWQQRINNYRTRLKNEVSLRELEERFTIAFRMSPVSVTISSVSDNKFIDVNNTFLYDMEYTREEVIGRTARELNIWADEREREWIINEISEKGKIFGKVFSYKTRTGKTLYGLSSMSVVNVNGEPCNLSTVVNITERRKSEEKLMESEELFRKLFENMLNGFAYCKMICEEGKFLDFLYLNVNEAFATLTGLKDVIGKRVSEAIPGIQEADPELLERYNRVSSTGIPEAFETYIESLKMWFAISVYSPQKGYFVAVFDVITARKLAEEKLQESRATLKSIIDNSNSLIYLVDTEGRFVMVNQHLQNLLSLSGEELIGQTREAFLPKEIADIHRKNDLVIIKTAKTQVFEEENIEPDGKHFYLTTKFPLFNDQNEIYCIGGLSTDITERKLAENTLHENEKRLHEAQEMAHLGFWLWDIKTGDVEWSEEVYKIFCLNPETFTPKIDSILELSPWPEDNQRDKELIARAMETHTPGDYEQKFLRPDKSVGFYYSTFRGNYDDSGNLISIVGTVLDITDRKNADLALSESEERFRSLYENVTIGIYRTTAEGQILLANPALVSMLGFNSFEQLANRNLEQEGYEPDYPRSKFLEKIDNEGKIIGLESAWNKKNGEVLYVRESAKAVRDARGKMLYYDGTVEDITDRKKVEEALRESEDKFKYVFDHSVSGKSITFPSGEIHINKAFCEMTGYSPEELANTKWQDISHPDDIKLTENELQSLISGEKKLTRFIKRYIHKNGNIVWADVGTALRRDEYGNPLYFMTTTIDITEQKLAEETIIKLNEELEQKVIQRTELLEAANKELEAFSYSVSHDLRAPLRSVHGFTKILLEDYEANLDEEGKRICGIISSSATQMGGLIDDLLSFSRIGRTSMNPSQLDMKSIVHSVFEDTCPASQKSRIKLKIGKLHKAFGDANLMKIVWTNLISNAIKYSSKEDNCEISISSSLKDYTIAYSIKDNGVGFDMKYKHKLFGVFQRLHSEAEFEGNGVGLAIVQRIILKHGGKVWAEGEEGKGATFYFSLPVQDINKETHDARRRTQGKH